MKVVVACDSFKGSLSALEAGNAVRTGILRAVPDAMVLVRPLADGGEGTVDALISGTGGSMHTVTVTGPLGAPVQARYGILPDGVTCVMEIAAAAGITLVPKEDLDPFHATTYGVGEMILTAIHNGCRQFIVGLGGSATNDGGAGMLEALGFGLLDRNNHPIPLGAEGLKKLDTITDRNVVPALKDCTFRVACDVTNPLLGSRGASAVFGPQKGASEEDIRQLDLALSDYAAVSKNFNPAADPDLPGAGAAGGLGFAFRTYMHASLESGVRIVLDALHLADDIRDADLVITGEGRLDAQTAMGKAPAGVAELAKKYGKPVIAFAGSCARNADACRQAGIDAYFPILREITPLSDAMKPENAAYNLAAAAEQVMHVFLLGQAVQPVFSQESP